MEFNPLFFQVLFFGRTPFHFMRVKDVFAFFADVNTQQLNITFMTYHTTQLHYMYIHSLTHSDESSIIVQYARILIVYHRNGPILGQRGGGV